MASSADVSSGDLATAAQYNNLRADVLNTSSGHTHTGTDSADLGTLTADLTVSQSGASQIEVISTANDAYLILNSDTDEGQDSELIFESGGTARGRIEYNHHATANSQLMSFFTADNAVETLKLQGNLATFGTAVDLGSNTLTSTGSMQIRTIDYSDGDLAMTIADGGGVTFAQNVTMDANLDMEGYSVFGNGSGLDSSYTLTIDRAFSDTSQAVSLRVRGTITSTDGTGTLAGFQVQPAGTVINSGNAHNVYSAWFIEPAITETSGSVTNAATVYIADAATEATNNYALWVDDGTTRIDGAITGYGDWNIRGTTPALTIGDAGEEDTKVVFDGHATDFYIGLDDGSDDLYIGSGSTVGSNPIMYFTTDGADIVMDTEEVYIQSSASSSPRLVLKNTNSDSSSAYLDFWKSTTDEADNDYCGIQRFMFKNTAAETIIASTIYSRSIDVTDSTEDGDLAFQVMMAGTLTTSTVLDPTGFHVGQNKQLHNTSSMVARNFVWENVKEVTGVTAYATQFTIAPSVVSNLWTHGLVEYKLMGHTSALANGGSHGVWYFDIADAAPTVGTAGSSTISTNGPLFRLSVSSNDVLCQVQSGNGSNTFDGTLWLKITLPRGAGSAGGSVTYTVT